MKLSRKLKIFLFVIFGSIAFIALLGYGFHFFWLMKYGASPEPVPDKILNVDQGFAFPPGFPPDPGEAGKRTIEGIDSDHDGVRDDVQRWIYAFVPNDRAKQMALRQDARVIQAILVEDYTHEARMKAIALSRRSAQCLSQVFHDEMYGYMETMYLKAKTLNTFARVERFWRNSDQVTTEEMAGAVERMKEPCENR